MDKKELIGWYYVGLEYGDEPTITSEEIVDLLYGFEKKKIKVTIEVIEE